ncbi:molybdopterin molybdotransferase MoeA [bacterium]|nr:molybdopterin molybdotransferase MoeA [bacterium]
MISFDEAYQQTLARIMPMGSELVSLLSAVGRIASQDFLAQVDSPTADVSLKDGFALHAADVEQASPENPIRIQLVGKIAAGGDWEGQVGSGEAVRILSGGRVPAGADAVLAEEFTQEDEDGVIALAHARAGRNILPARTDIYVGKKLVQKGERLTPVKVGLLASAGYSEVPVFRKPRVAVIATGDEVIAPGNPLPDGKLYASNLVTLAGWCVSFGFEVETFVVPDDWKQIQQAMTTALNEFDLVMTSGGAWKSDRDLVVHILESLGWEKIYHRIKIGPGKAVGFGFCQNKPVFLLPGGPPSNHMAFLQLVVPAMHQMAGWPKLGFPLVPARLGKTLRGQIDWTQFEHGCLEKDEQGADVFYPSRQTSRLQMMASSNAVAKIPEGTDHILEGEIILVQKLS